MEKKGGEFGGGRWVGWVLGLCPANGERSLISSADDALSDLRTLVSLDDNRRLVLSYRRSTLRFLANSVAVCFIVILGFRALFCLLSMLHSSGYRSGAGHVVVRRDWSLGGKEVVVARRMESLKTLSSLLSAAAKEGVLGGSVNERVTLRKKRLPKWWRICSKMKILFLYQWWTSRTTRETPID